MYVKYVTLSTERGGIPRREAARDPDTRGAQCDVFHIHHYASIKYLHYFTFANRPLQRSVHTSLTFGDFHEVRLQIFWTFYSLPPGTKKPNRQLQEAIF